nr:hypothetical protein [Methanobrevibacter sp.]
MTTQSMQTSSSIIPRSMSSIFTFFTSIVGVKINMPIIPIREVTKAIFSNLSSVISISFHWISY